MNYYWLLEYGDPRNPKTIMIPPDAAEVVKRRWDNKDPIHTTQGSIPAAQIRSFEPTDKIFTDQLLLESAAQAFHEPEITEGGAIVSHWVKKSVTMERWSRYYSQSPGYKALGERDGRMEIAFKIAIHDIHPQTVQVCNDYEVSQLTQHN